MVSEFQESCWVFSLDASLYWFSQQSSQLIHFHVSLFMNVIHFNLSPPFFFFLPFLVTLLSMEHASQQVNFLPFLQSIIQRGICNKSVQKYTHRIKKCLHHQLIIHIIEQQVNIVRKTSLRTMKFSRSSFNSLMLDKLHDLIEPLFSYL